MVCDETKLTMRLSETQLGIVNAKSGFGPIAPIASQGKLRCLAWGLRQKETCQGQARPQQKGRRVSPLRQLGSKRNSSWLQLRLHSIEMRRLAGTRGIVHQQRAVA